MRRLLRPLSLLAATIATACSPIQALNTADRVLARGGVRQVADGVTFGSDVRQTLDVYAPPHAAHAPVVVFFYGGSWSSGRRQDYGFAARAFAAEGFIVVVPDYRLVPQIAYPAFVEDGASAVRWTRHNIERFGGDPDRIAVAGHSAGAYVALMLALDPKWVGDPHAIRAAVGLSGPYDFYPFDKPASIAAFGKFPDGPATQPINLVRADAPPMFLLHGGRDDTVKPRNSLRLAEAETKAGGQATAKVYPALDHIDVLLALSAPFRRKGPVLGDAVQFLHRTLG